MHRTEFNGPAFAIAVAALLAACSSRSGRPPPGSGVDAGPHADSGTAGSCSGTRCTGATFERCVEGRWLLDQVCAEGTACDEASGCAQPDACSLARLERSNMGCEYFAVDLPQPRVTSWPLSLGSPWRAQFGVAVSNPNDSGTVVRVEQNDALPGALEVTTVVTEVAVPPNSVRMIPLPSREVSGLASDTGPPSRSGVTNLAYRITSTLPIVAYQFNPIANEGVFADDASLLVPTHSLDESYVAIGWPGQGAAAPAGVPADNRSFLTIVATQDGTKVRVVPSTGVQPGDGVPARAAGEPIEVRLDRFGVLNVQGADFAIVGEADFTGSRVEADRPVAVFSGVEAITISTPDHGYCCADHLEEQLLPRSALGSDYVVVRSSPRRPARVGPPEPDYFKILAIADDTTVTTSLAGADASFTLMRGDFRLILSDMSFTVSASEAVVIGQFLLSGEAIHPPVVDPFTGDVIDEGEQIGDPSFMTVPPIAQFRTQYRFLVPDGYERNFALIAAPAGTVIMSDGTALWCTRASVGAIDGAPYEALHCPLEPGAQHLSAEAPFGVVVEGWGPGVVSYGYTGGMDFERITADCHADTECPGGEFCSGGYCVPEIVFI